MKAIVMNGTGGREMLEYVERPEAEAGRGEALVEIGYATYYDHVHTPALLRARTAQLFDWLAEGRLTVQVGAEYPLVDAAQVHADMESRGTIGKLLLVP